MSFETKKKINRILLIRTVSRGAINRAHHPYGNRFPFMLKYMEALLRQGRQYNVKFIDTLIEPVSKNGFLKILQDWSPELLVIHSTSRDLQVTLDYATISKKINRETIIVSVGQDATARPKNYLFNNSPVDIAIPGEAELELLNLIDRLNNGTTVGEIKNSYLGKGPFIVSDLDRLPFPDCTGAEIRRYFHIYPLDVKKRLVWGHILSSRGCPYNCIFCSQVLRESFGKEVRLRNVSYVVDEMEYLIKKGVNIVIFDDDNFTTRESHVLGICNEILRRKLKVLWSAHARVDNVSFELLKIMKESGCILLRFGIESASNRVLKILKKTVRDDWVDESRKVFRFCEELNINTAALFLIGSPTETKEEIRASIKLAKELNPSIIQVSFFTLYPGSEACQKLERSAKIPNVTSLYHYLAPESNMNFSNLSSNQLQEMHKIFYKEFLLSPKFLIKHFARYVIFYLYNPFIFLSLLQIIKYLAKRNKNGKGKT